MMRRRIRLAAVLAVVVLALTGFQTSGHGGKSGGKSRGGKSSGSGGGCSNSKKSNGGYRDYSDDDYDDTSSSSGGSTYTAPTPTATATEAPEVRVVRCVRPKKGKRKAVTSSTVEIRSASSTSHTYEVDVTFVDADGTAVDTGEATVDLAATEAKTVTVRMDSPRAVSRVKRCLVTAELRY
ncbi:MULTISPECIES: hypothetical protein [Streptomyces]|uniref:Secreted protein n=1 Tax=Streptomyces flavovirens TaxID=52258 RepID=A0ABV8N615_9ACTN|nr:hypothetical protein [Streptomyces sp. MBT51]MBK3591712.1 hypothetical protein [Streptomyces sp. MBT51]HBF85924.1 hypothetical protein [Streptomyces sp.]